MRTAVKNETRKCLESGLFSQKNRTPNFPGRGAVVVLPGAQNFASLPRLVACFGGEVMPVLLPVRIDYFAVV